jgi:hypothetical protein
LRDHGKVATAKEWRAEVIVTSDCERTSPDGSRVIIHNRIATTYDLNRRLPDRTVPTWTGRTSTAYTWAVETDFGNRRDVEESAASFETDGKLQLTDSVTIRVGRVPGRPFTRKKYAGDTLLETSTANDEPPAAELLQVPLPGESGVATGSRTEDGYALLGGLVLTCPAQRQWTLRVAS